ncbi:MAG TPA: AraC family transcriptional regulator [Sphingomonadaceae bacterium]|nr:AraC family transcriptional regulator [Sphingomonadaceae bacterium]
MSDIQTAEVATLNPRERTSQFSSIISEGFSSRWSVEQIGGVAQRTARISWARADGVSITRSQMTPLRLVNHCPAWHRSRKLYISTADQITAVTVPGAPTVYVYPGDFIILPSDMPTEWAVTKDYDHSCLVIDEEIFRAHVPGIHELIARPLAFDFSLKSIMRDMIDSAWAMSCAGMFDTAGPRLARSFLELLSIATLTRNSAPEDEERTLYKALEARRIQVKNFIEKHYHEPELSVGKIARGLRLSPRYVQLAFAQEDLTPSQYMREVRLNASARLLSDERQDRKSITEICFDCGFNSSSHFSTQFRRHFGMSPRRYRSEARGFAKSS